MEKQKLETKRVGDIMYSRKGLKERIYTYVGGTILNRTPALIERLVAGGFTVTQELLFECWKVKVPAAESEIAGIEYPITADEAATIVCPSLDAQIEKRTSGLNEFQRKDALNSLNTHKAKVFGLVYQAHYYLLRKFGNIDEELALLFKITEYKDKKLCYVRDYDAKLEELTAVYFQTQAAVDIYNQHVRAFEEMQKLYGLIRNNFIRQMQCTPAAFIEFDFGEIGFPNGIDYELLAKKSGI